MPYKHTVKTLKILLLNYSLTYIKDNALMEVIDELENIQNAEPKSTEASRKLGWCTCLLVERGIVDKKTITNLIKKDILAGDE